MVFAHLSACNSLATVLQNLAMLATLYLLPSRSSYFMDDRLRVRNKLRAPRMASVPGVPTDHRSPAPSGPDRTMNRCLFLCGCSRPGSPSCPQGALKSRLRPREQHPEPPTPRWPRYAALPRLGPPWAEWPAAQGTSSASHGHPPDPGPAAL